MAKIDVYKYYTQCTQQVVNLNNSIKDLQESLGDKSIDKDKLEYLQNMVIALKDNCDRLGYIVYLLKQPRFGIFKKRYNQLNKNLFERFKDMKVTKEDILLENNLILDKVKEYLKYCEEEINNE